MAQGGTIALSWFYACFPFLVRKVFSSKVDVRYHRGSNSQFLLMPYDTIFAYKVETPPFNREPLLCFVIVQTGKKQRVRSIGEAMSHPPMEEYLLPSSGQRHRVVCYDLETTGLELVDEIVQIGGSVDQARIFSKYIVPATRRVHPVAARIIGLQVMNGRKGLQDLRDNTPVDAVDEGSGLKEFLHWLEEVRGDVDGIILASHGAIFLDIPVLLIALRRNKLIDRFKQIVSGFCDTYAIFRADLKIRDYKLQSLYEQFIGRRPEKHRAQEDARDLHTILTTYFKTEQLSMELRPLAQATYTVRCMEEYTSWRESIEPHRVDLMTITASWNVRGDKLKKVLVKNLLAAGYTYKRLADEFRIHGDQVFKNRLEQSILHMKMTYESYLTDTKDMSARVVANRVLEHFKC
uniref:Exonuclease domain-containing protein n=1 Tax=Timema cristinae TaxID=61476 RepID=A0A7R9D261_TIMCR|nr:unnamed protein product [Timema cristinae]